MTNEQKANHNRELCRRIQAGDKDAEAEIIKFNNGFIGGVVKKHIYKGGADVPGEDLLQEGRLGMIEAAKRFDGSKGNGFLTYADYWINQYIIKANTWQGHNIRMPDNIIAELNKLARIEHKYEGLPDEEIKQKVYEEMDYPEYRVRELYRIREYLQTTSISDFDDTEVDDFLKADTGESVEDRAIDRLLRECLEKSMQKHLTEREIDIVKRRAGWFRGGDYEAIEEIAKSYGVTRERVRQIEMRAYRKMKYWVAHEARGYV